MDIDAIVQELRDLGLDVRIDSVPGRPGRTFSPLGVMPHHTASNAASGDLPSLGTVKYGRVDVRGPLCNWLAGRLGTLVLITTGSANHSGGGTQEALDRFFAFVEPRVPITRDDHRHMSDISWGIEVENNGVGEPYPLEQYQAVVTLTAVLCKHSGVTRTERIPGHKEWTRRKIDPSFDTHHFRLDVRKKLDEITAPPPPTPPVPPEDFMPDQADRVIREILDALGVPDGQTLTEYVREVVQEAAITAGSQVIEQQVGSLLMVRGPGDKLWTLGPNGTRHQITELTGDALSDYKEKFGTNFNSRKLGTAEWELMKLHWPTEV